MKEYLYKNATLIDYRTELPDYWLQIYKAVMADQSQEHLIFKSNLDEMIAENIKQTGIDPRIAGPPLHIKSQTVNTISLEQVLP